MLDKNGQDIFLTRGDTASLEFIPIMVQTDENYVFQEGDRVFFRLRQMPGYGKLIEKECVINLDDNTCVLTLTPKDTANLPMREHRYEVELIDVNEDRYTFIADQPFTIGRELEEHGGTV